MFSIAVKTSTYSILMVFLEDFDPGIILAFSSDLISCYDKMPKKEELFYLLFFLILILQESRIVFNEC